MEAVSPAPLDPDDAPGAGAPSPWAILEIAPDSLPAPADGYVDLFAGDEEAARGLDDASAGATVVAAAPQDGPPPSPETRRASKVAAIPSPHLLAPEVLLVAAFLATGGAVAALAKLDAPAAAPPPLVAGTASRAGAVAAGEAPSAPAARPVLAPRGRSRATRTSLAAGEPLPAPSAEALPPAPAPEPVAVHDAAADAPLAGAPALRSRAVLVAEEAAAGRPAVARRPRLAEAGCLAAALRHAPLALSGTAKVRLAVEADGAVSSVELLSGATEPAVAAALGAAIAGCRFVPGADAAGNPLPLAHVLAIDFVAR